MKLEIGKRYVRRDGKVTDPLEENDGVVYKLKDPNTAQSYAENGHYIHESDLLNDFDLVSEFNPPAVDVIPQPIVARKAYIDHTKPPKNKSPYTANDIQYGGDHYKSQAIQPWDYITSNNLGFLEGNAVKYLSRWRQKNGIEDLKKAIHYIEKLIEVETKCQKEQQPNPDL